MPDEINSAGWVLVSWGFACGFALATAVWLGMHWTYRIRTHVTVAGAAEQRIEAKRDRAALRERRRLYAQKCANPTVSPFDALAAHGKPAPPRAYPRPPLLVVEPDPRRVRPVIEHVDYINTAVSVEPWAVDAKSRAVILDEPPMPDEERPVPTGDDDYPRVDTTEEAKTGRHRAPDWLLEDDTRQILSVAGARVLREAGR